MVSEEKIKKFLSLIYGSGSGYGYGDGDGYGYGYGYGDGSGYGDGDGSGSGSGSGYGYGDGSGYGDGDGSGSGSGYGYGYGYGDGSGDGDGYGDGSGYGDGYGDGVLAIDGQKVWSVDEVPTLFNSVRGNVAKGFILNKDLTRTPCFVARVGNSFAHGATLHEAVRDATAKDMERRPVSERIKAFVKAHPRKDVVISGRELYDWHHVLTGSCKAGRDAWCRDNGLSPDKDEMTAEMFCRLTVNSYGGDVIRLLAKEYGIKL